MEEKEVTIELKDFMECLRDENNKLINQLSFAQKCMKLFEDYRKCLIGFTNTCICEHTFNHQMIFNSLERNYKHIIQEDMTNSAIIPEKTINVSFNKQNITKTIDKNNIESNKQKETTNEDNNKEEENCGNVLTKKICENLKHLEDNEDYRLKYLRNKRQDNSEHFGCNWFNCGQIFASEANLSQHIRSEHFRVLEYSDDIIFDGEPQEMIIKCDPELIKPKHLPELKIKAKRVLPEFVCKWIGCELEFRTEIELKRHENSVHNKQKYSSQHSTHLPKIPKFSGLKPLRIHTLDEDPSEDYTPSEKNFKCELCDKSFTRRDSLRQHIKNEHTMASMGSTPHKLFYCDHCEYETKNNSHMKRHILRRHTNERPFKCDLGNCHPDIKCFATLDQLRSHQMNIHPNEIF